RWRPHMLSSFRCSGTSSATAATESSLSFNPGFGAEGENDRPHWRQIVDFAATYSICLKPQCGHSTLALAGEDLITSSEGGGQTLRSPSESRFGWFVVPTDFWTGR